MSQRLIFVYNANAGRLNAILDTAHKMVSPGTYQCALCGITHGLFGERKEWREFRESLPLPVAFYHKDQFERESGRRYSYPIVLGVAEGCAPVVLLGPADIARCGSVRELGRELERALAASLPGLDDCQSRELVGRET